jgi:tetratricopeptide (TPR) repeat protein
MDLYEKAAATLTEAVGLAPDASFAIEALERIVYAYARLDRPQDELEAWHRYIPKLVDPRTRTVALMNMGEAEMRLGKVDDALATFNEVLRACGELPNTSSTYVLALWDLAVALDRSGDARGALDAATRATQQTAIDSTGTPRRGRDLLTDDPSVFFVPDWEKNWYLALGDEAMARQDTDLRDSAAHYARAEAEWSQYVASATAAATAVLRPDRAGAPPPSDGVDPSARLAIQQWLRIAQLRHERALTARKAVLARLPRGVAQALPGSLE